MLSMFMKNENMLSMLAKKEFEEQLEKDMHKKFVRFLKENGVFRKFIKNYNNEIIGVKYRNDMKSANNLHTVNYIHSFICTFNWVESKEGYNYWNFWNSYWLEVRLLGY